MSVAGILASSLFSNAISQIGQKSPSTTKQPGASTGFSEIQQKLASSSAAGVSSLPADFIQLGKDFESRNPSSPPTQLGTVHTISTPTPGSTSNQPPRLSREGELSNDPLSTAWQAYSALQGNSLGNSLANSLVDNAGNLSINI